MSRHRIVHTFNANDIVSEFDGEDYDEEEDELSPEDRVAMANGTAEVRIALRSEANKVTTDQIQEALWHYYYDVDKSVTYLMKTYIAPAPKPTPKKAASDLERPEYGSRCGTLISTSTSFCSAPETSKASYAHCFNDMPWLNVPQDRQTIFVEPIRPRGGLLGGGEGAPKMSKLQALAAARKKKSEEKKEQDKTQQAEKGISKLSIKDNSRKENREPVAGLAAKRQKTSDTSSFKPQRRPSDPSQSDHDSAVQMDNAPEEPEAPAGDKWDSWDIMAGFKVVAPPRPKPSAFARTLLGLDDPPRVRKPDDNEIMPLPYAKNPAFRPEAFDEPSPDDIVLAAQAKAGKKITPAPKATKKPQNKGDEVAKEIGDLKIVETPPKSKGLDVIKEFEQSKNKRSISFVVVGHVDAGKSTLMGRLLLELKFVEQHTIDRYRKLAEKSGKQSFALAWVMDQRSEERERGVTIDIATNYFETEKTNFTILDAPGHRDFVPNMIAGASQADFAILVIDASTGAYERGLKGQTREHVLLLRSLGVQRLVIAVNKLDAVDWSQARFEEIEQQVTGFLTGLGFQGKNVCFIPISGLNGDNLVKRTEAPSASWYTGTTLIEALENSEPSTARALKSPFRMAVSEIFRSAQGTTSIAGRVESGSVQIGDSVMVQPAGDEAYVKSIEVDSDLQDWAVAGQNISLALTELDPEHLRVGDMLCPSAQPIKCVDTFTMKAMAFEHLLPMPVDLHRGRLHAAGNIQSLIATLDKATGAVIKKRPKVVQPGAVARIVVKLAVPAPLEPGQRVVIRSGGETIAAGLLE